MYINIDFNDIETCHRISKPDEINSKQLMYD